MRASCTAVAIIPQWYSINQHFPSQEAPIDFYDAFERRAQFRLLFTARPRAVGHEMSLRVAATLASLFLFYASAIAQSSAPGCHPGVYEWVCVLWF